MGLGDYLQLLDWTGRQIRSDKRGAMPAHLEPLFERPGHPDRPMPSRSDRAQIQRRRWPIPEA